MRRHRARARAARRGARSASCCARRRRTPRPSSRARLYEETEGLPFLLVEYLNSLGADPDWALPAGARELLLRAPRPGQRDRPPGARRRRGDRPLVRRRHRARRVRPRRRGDGRRRSRSSCARGLVREGALRLRLRARAAAAAGGRGDRPRAAAAAARPRGGRAGRRPAGAAEVARHLRLAGRDAEAAAAYRRAAEHARALFANAEALEHLRAALAVGDPGAGLAARRDRRPADAAGRVRAPRSPPTRRPRRSRAPTTSARSSTGSARSATGAASGRSRPRTSRPRSPPRPRATARAARADLRRPVAERATTAATRRAPPSSPSAPARWPRRPATRARSARPTTCSARSPPAAARRPTRSSTSAAASQLAEATGDPGARVAALNNLALAHRARGELEPALELTGAALELCAAQGDRHREAALHNNLADLLHAAGRHEEAMDAAQARGGDLRRGRRGGRAAAGGVEARALVTAAASSRTPARIAGSASWPSAPRSARQRGRAATAAAGRLPLAGAAGLSRPGDAPQRSPVQPGHARWAPTAAILRASRGCSSVG